MDYIKYVFNEVAERNGLKIKKPDVLASMVRDEL